MNMQRNFCADNTFGFHHDKGVGIPGADKLDF